MNSRLLAILCFCASALFSCEQPCGPSNCAGCCNANNYCVPSPANATTEHCGGAGLACATCLSSQICDPSRLVCIEGENPTVCSSPPVQTLSEPCCMTYGVDACGAGLFCSAFDGRTRATCYANYSRLNQEECTDDRQCASQSCNTSENKCRGMVYELCSTSIGCAPTTTAGTPLTCMLLGAQMRCGT